MKTALVHDWLSGVGGGEKVLESIYSEYPGKIHTLIHDAKKMERTFFEGMDINTSFLQAIPFSSKLYRNFLPLFPFAIEQFDLSEYDLILSSSHAVAKGVLRGANQLHICYCHSPMRYAWDLYSSHMKEVRGLKRLAAKMTLHSLRQWDVVSANRVDHFIANSRHIAMRIKKIYGRESTVIYPPVDVSSFYSKDKKEDYYITYSRLVPYKKVDLIVEAFSKMPGKRLLVIGDGPEMPRLKKMAAKNIELLGFQDDTELRKLLAGAKGFIFAAEEDFGIVLVEALASGVPVIAFGKGASREIVEEGQTGLFFAEQSISSLVDAVKSFELMRSQLDPEACVKSAQRFSSERFSREFKAFVEEKKRDFFELNN